MALPYLETSSGARGHFNFRQQDGTRTHTSVTVEQPISAQVGDRVVMEDWERRQICEVTRRSGGGQYFETYQLVAVDA